VCEHRLSDCRRRAGGQQRARGGAFGRQRCERRQRLHDGGFAAVVHGARGADDVQQGVDSQHARGVACFRLAAALLDVRQRGAHVLQRRVGRQLRHGGFAHGAQQLRGDAACAQLQVVHGHALFAQKVLKPLPRVVLRGQLPRQLLWTSERRRACVSFGAQRRARSDGRAARTATTRSSRRFTALA
jgi:hypothetical protein